MIMPRDTKPIPTHSKMSGIKQISKEKKRKQINMKQSLAAPSQYLYLTQLRSASQLQSPLTPPQYQSPRPAAIQLQSPPTPP